MLKLVAAGPVFVTLYILVMIPTYFLPLLGSNSAILNSPGKAAGAGMNPAFWLHLFLLFVLCAFAWARGAYVGKTWIVIFPFLALVFDLVPGLSLIPLIPTAMHLLAIIIGVSSKKVEVT